MLGKLCHPNAANGQSRAEPVYWMAAITGSLQIAPISSQKTSASWSFLYFLDVGIHLGRSSGFAGRLHGWQDQANAEPRGRDTGYIAPLSPILRFKMARVPPLHAEHGA